MTYVIEVVVMTNNMEEAQLFIDQIDIHLETWVRGETPLVPYVIDGPIERVPVETVMQMIRNAEIDDE